MYDQSVSSRDVETGFDNRSRQQHIVFAVVECGHDVFEDGRRHLAMGDRDTHLWNVLVEEILSAGEILDARTDIERLAAAVALAQQRVSYDQGIERRHEGAHGEPIDRRGSDDRKIADA